MVPPTICPAAHLASQRVQHPEGRRDMLRLMAASLFHFSSGAHRMALFSPSSSRTILVRLPVRVNPDLRAPVPAYWREMSSPWSAHRILKRCSTCRQSCMKCCLHLYCILGQGETAHRTRVWGAAPAADSCAAVWVQERPLRNMLQGCSTCMPSIKK